MFFTIPFFATASEWLFAGYFDALEFETILHFNFDAQSQYFAYPP